MNYKKMLGIIFVVVVAMISLMLTTSYAWYSFQGASTTFNTVTNNDDIIVSFLRGEYINTSVAVPITSNDVDKYSEKNNFTIKVKDNAVDNEMVVTISLVEIVIDDALKNSSFKIDLYHKGSKISTITGAGISGTSISLGNVTLDNDLDNNFEVRVYILDDDSDQSSMMNKSFQAKIKVDVVSRLKTEFNDFSNPDIYVSSILIDGESSNYLPVSGYYSMSASCIKGSSLSWDPLSKTITYASGSYVNDSCSLTFTSNINYPKLSEMEVGSYVQYTGNNGCDGRHCEGDNANYVSDDDMGYCYRSFSKFAVNGWRIGYIKDNTAYLVSAGAPECLATYIYSRSSSTSIQNLSNNYYYGSGYLFDDTTGKFSLTGVTSSTLAWSSNYESIIANTPYTCKSTSSTATCKTLYEVTAYSSSTQGVTYPHYSYETTEGVPIHLQRLNQAALKYCNSTYAYGGVCDSTSTWAMNAADFEQMVGKALSSGSCYVQYGNKSCGYTNDLIDNGGFYWFATSLTSSSIETFDWHPNYRYVSNSLSNDVNGVRPVLRLESGVLVVGGSGTYEDPYIISKG